MYVIFEETRCQNTLREVLHILLYYNRNVNVPQEVDNSDRVHSNS